MANAVPEGFRTLTPYLKIRDAAAAIDFYKAAFGAAERARMTMPDGKSIMHAELQIGDSILMLTEEAPAWRSLSPLSLGGTGSAVHVYVPDVDAVYASAVAAGATGQMPPTKMFWGDRFAKVTDPFGHEWSIATHVEDVPEAEMEQRAAAAFAQMPKPPAK